MRSDRPRSATPSRRGWLCVSLLFLLLFGAGAATASPTAPGPAAQARALTESGLRKYQIGDYAGAIADFKQAYLLDPQPPLLYNIAQSHRLSGDCESARRFYGNYLRDAPNASNRATVEGRMMEMQHCIDERAAHPPEPAAPVAPSQPTPIAPPTVAVVAPPPAPVTPPPRRLALKIIGPVSLALGVALVATGGAMSARAVDASDQVGALFSSGGQWNDHYGDLQDRGRGATTASIALYAIGGAALVTGVVLTTLAFLPPRARRAFIPSSDGTGVACAF